jgi:2-keto-4-pentenoate hydratase/2-oxohepta-3-ene-1,7-dioic acid hydratase in catechol pathway
MRIIRFVDRDGVVRFGEPVDYQSARLVRGSLSEGFRSVEDTAVVERLLPPVAPPNIFAIGLNYRAHAAESGAEPPAEPLIFLKATSSVIADGEPIVLPRSAPDEVDFEAELAVIIGRTARNVPEADALDHVAGYTCANDVSARDCQRRRDKQWARAKSFDTFCPLGPVMATADAIDSANVAIRSELNGEGMQDSTTADMIFPVRFLVSYLSHQFTLAPGTVILTGTPPGVGFARKPPRYLRSGDQISVALDGIGRLTNPVVAPAV